MRRCKARWRPPARPLRRNGEGKRGATTEAGATLDQRELPSIPRSANIATKSNLRADRRHLAAMLGKVEAPPRALSAGTARARGGPPPKPEQRSINANCRLSHDPQNIKHELSIFFDKTSIIVDRNGDFNGKL